MDGEMEFMLLLFQECWALPASLVAWPSPCPHGQAHPWLACWEVLLFPAPAGPTCPEQARRFLATEGHGYHSAHLWPCPHLQGQAGVTGLLTGRWQSCPQAESRGRDLPPTTEPSLGTTCCCSEPPGTPRCGQQARPSFPRPRLSVLVSGFWLPDAPRCSTGASLAWGQWDRSTLS